MTSIKITTEIQKLQPSAVVDLYILDMTSLGDTIYRFHAGTNGLKQDIVWQGQTYQAFPVQITGFEYTGSGTIPRPKLAVANLTGAISLLALTYKDMIGAKITRKRTLLKYIDAVNFPGGVNATADSTAEFPDEIYFVDRKSGENRDVVEFELASSFDVQGVMLPRRQIVQNVCPWKYRGIECGYKATVYFTVDDVSTASASQDVCGKRLSSCEVRFGEKNPLPFGGFPSAGLVR